jgi:hypothetical protein
MMVVTTWLPLNYCSEFLLWILPGMAFPKGLISAGNNLISSAKKILQWCWPMSKMVLFLFGILSI